MRWIDHDRTDALSRTLSAAARPLRRGWTSAAQVFRNAAERVPTSVLDSFPRR